MTLNRVPCLVRVLILMLAGGCDLIQMLPLAALGGTSVRMQMYVEEVQEEFIGGVRVILLSLDPSCPGKAVRQSTSMIRLISEMSLPSHCRKVLLR